MRHNAQDKECTVQGWTIYIHCTMVAGCASNAKQLPDIPEATMVDYAKAAKINAE